MERFSRAFLRAAGIRISAKILRADLWLSEFDSKLSEAPSSESLLPTFQFSMTRKSMNLKYLNPNTKFHVIQ